MANIEEVSGVFGGVKTNDENANVSNNAGVFGGVSINEESANNANTFVNARNLPAKTGFWNKVKSVLFYDIKVELTPAQQKVEDEINEFLHQEITWGKVKDFLFQEVTFGKKN